MPTLARRWALRRLRVRLRRAERAKNAAMQALVVRDRCVAPRGRFDYQDPGQLATMLDEIAMLRARIAGMEMPADRLFPVPAAPPPARFAPAAPACGRGALDPLFGALRDELQRIQRETPGGRIGGAALRRALAAAFASAAVQDAAFDAMRAEMLRIQHAAQPGRIGLAGLRDAVRAALVGPEPAPVPAAADACPAGAISDRPAA